MFDEVILKGRTIYQQNHQLGTVVHRERQIPVTIGLRAVWFEDDSLILLEVHSNLTAIEDRKTITRLIGNMGEVVETARAAYLAFVREVDAAFRAEGGQEAKAWREHLVKLGLPVVEEPKAEVTP